MRVLTLNLWGRRESWPQRREVLRAGLAELSPDLAVFQEAVLTDDHDQVREVLGPEYHVVHQTGRSPDGTGASIASRWPASQVVEQSLRASVRQNPEHGWIGGVAAARFATPLGPVLLVHHKPSWQLGFERERELQAVATAQLTEKLVENTGAHVILAGDFAATPESASLRFWRGLQSLEGVSVCYRDCWTGPNGNTFTPSNPLVRNGRMPAPEPRRVDYLMVRCDEYGPTLGIGRSWVVFDEPRQGIWAAGHFGVCADLG